MGVMSPEGGDDSSRAAALDSEIKFSVLVLYHFRMLDKPAFISLNFLICKYRQ